MRSKLFLLLGLIALLGSTQVEAKFQTDDPSDNYGRDNIDAFVVDSVPEGSSSPAPSESEDQGSEDSGDLAEGSSSEQSSDSDDSEGSSQSSDTDSTSSGSDTSGEVSSDTSTEEVADNPADDGADGDSEDSETSLVETSDDSPSDSDSSSESDGVDTEEGSTGEVNQNSDDSSDLGQSEADGQSSESDSNMDDEETDQSPDSDSESSEGETNPIIDFIKSIFTSETDDVETETEVEIENNADQNANTISVEISGAEYRSLESTQTTLQSFISDVSEIEHTDDLESYVVAAYQSDASVEDISMSERTVEVTYSQPARLFGFIPVRYTQNTKVYLNETSNVALVAVDQPWWLIFASGDVDPDELALTLKTELEKGLADEVLDEESVKSLLQRLAGLLDRIIEFVSNIF